METPEAFYHVRARNSCESPDPRARREHMLLEMSHRIRDYPTIPADPNNHNECWKAALAEDMAIELSLVHCSCRECACCGTNDDKRDAHIIDAHIEELLPIADILPKCFHKMLEC